MSDRLATSPEQIAYEMIPLSRPMHALAVLLSISFVGLLLALFFAPWVQTASATGRVIAYAPVERQQTLQSPVEGRIVHWHVVEGSHVKAGDAIVDLSDVDPLILTRLEQERSALVSRIRAAEARRSAIGSRRSSLEGSRRAALTAAEQRVTMAKERLRAAEQALTAAEAADRTAKLNIERLRALTREGLRSRRDLELAELEETRMQTDADRARAALSATRAEQEAARADVSKIMNDATASVDDARASQAAAESEIATANAELARIEVRLSRQQAQAVKAPRDGTVLRLMAMNEAELIKVGTPLAILVPDTDNRAVELWVDGNDAPLIAAKRRVRLQFEGWPAVQFTGWPSVAIGTFGGEVALIDSHDDGKGRFRVLITPTSADKWPAGVFLRQGTRVNGWILLNQVRLGYELWRRFNGFPPVVATDEAAALMQRKEKP